MKKITILEKRIKETAGNLPTGIKEDDGLIYGKYFDGWKVLSDEEIDGIIERLKSKAHPDVFVDEWEAGELIHTNRPDEYTQPVIRRGRWEINKDLKKITMVIDLHWGV